MSIHKHYQTGMSIVPSRYHACRVLLYTDVLSTVVLFFFVNLFLPSLLYSLCFLFVLYCETLVAVFVRPDITALVDWA